MYLKAGTYTHRVDEAGISIRRSAEVDGSGSVWAWKEVWDIKAMLLNTSGVPGDLDASIAALEAAYATELSYIGLLHDDGTTPTKHEILTTDTLGGIRVTSPLSYPEYRGAEYVTKRNYTITIECLRKKRFESGQIFDLKENLEIKSGGPIYGFLTPNEGTAVKQLLRTSEPWFATQSGTITGIESFPSPPAAIWPSHQLRPVVEHAQNARKVGNTNAGYFLYPVTYRYEFGSTSALSGAPTSW